MDRIKVVVLGLGNYGHSWATSAIPQCGDCAELVAVVERDHSKWEGIDESIPKFENLDDAVDAVHPNLVINVTPPKLHLPINESILRKNIAVLCEKPISDSFENAVKMAEVLKETNGFLMIGENYRYYTVFQTAKKMISSEELGEIHRLDCHFRHYHPDYSMFYHGSLPHPLLEDVSVHHLDLARFLSSAEPVKVWCKEKGADYSWYGERPANAVIVSEMTNGVLFHYDGTLSSPQSTTDWNGRWEIECEKGVLEINGNTITVYKNDEVKTVTAGTPNEDSRIVMLKEACAAMKEGRKGSTDFSDNFNSFRWVRKAIESSEKGDWVVIE